MTTLSNGLPCVLATQNHSVKPWKHLTRDWLLDFDHYFLKILSIWAVTLETQQRYFSNDILAPNATPKISSGLIDRNTLSGRPHRQCGGLSFRRSCVRVPLAGASLLICGQNLHRASGTHGYCPVKVGGSGQSIGSTVSDAFAVAGNGRL